MLPAPRPFGSRVGPGTSCGERAGLVRVRVGVRDGARVRVTVTVRVGVGVRVRDKVRVRVRVGVRVRVRGVVNDDRVGAGAEGITHGDAPPELNSRPDEGHA